MESFVNLVTTVNNAVNSVVWGVPALILLVGMGFVMTFLTKFFQFTHFGHWMKETIGKLFSKKTAGGIFVAIAVCLFAFSTTLGWSVYGCKAWEYLFGAKSLPIYKVIFVAAIMMSCVMDASLAIDLSDAFNGLMAIPNLIGVLTMSGTVIAITKNYIDRKLKGKDISPLLSYDPKINEDHAKAVANGED